MLIMSKKLNNRSILKYEFSVPKLRIGGLVLRGKRD